MNSLESELGEPRFSKASGINLYADGSPWYLASFLAEINSAADPLREEEAARYDSARVVATVTSHAMSLPSRHGSDVAPSGLFPEPLTNPAGSLRTGFSAEVKALATMSFRA